VTEVGSKPSEESPGSARPEHAALHEAIRALPDRQREITVLRYLLGFSTQEVAETLGCPEGTVKSNLHKAIFKLYTMLQASEAADEVHRV
jgi:RNA polymerase sigma-70 factor (ECF subfamily)